MPKDGILVLMVGLKEDYLHLDSAKNIIIAMQSSICSNLLFYKY